MQIDIDKILQAKAPEATKAIPHFIVDYLKRIVHQDEINDALEKFGNLQGVDFADNIIRHTLGCTYKAHGLEHILPGRKYVFASNHPLGGLDGMIIIACIGKIFGNIKFFVNDLLMYLEPMRDIFLPVNKFGHTNRESARTFNEAFASDAQILYFPAGLCSRKHKGEISDPQWKSSFVKKAKEYGREIVPVYFEGRNSDFFYRLANARKALRIKFNVEMMYLPDEMFRQKGNSFNIYFGSPISAESLSGTNAEQWTQEIRRIVYSLKTTK